MCENNKDVYYHYEDPPLNPCNSNKKIAVNRIINSKNNELKTKTGAKRENGYTFERNQDGSINPIYKRK